MTDSHPRLLPPVSSLSEYLQRITDITSEEQKDRSQALFYRGHADSGWKLEPAVYRIDQDGKSYRDVELQMYQEMLRRSPQAFQDCKTTFERLVKMQHYGLPTRLLDLTQSPLVALYFACCEKNGSDNEPDGEVLVIRARKENVYFQESLPSSALFEFDSQYSLKDVLGYIFWQYKNKTYKFYNIVDTLETIEDDFKERIKDLKDKLLNPVMVVSTGNEEHLYNYIIRSIQLFDNIGIEIQKQNRRSNKEEYICLLGELHGMNTEIFTNISDKYNINISNTKLMLDFVSSYVDRMIIYPPLNNERIQKQQGVFICFPKCWFVKAEPNFSIEQIVIAANKKTAILDELKTMGITQAYLFPELDVQANDIKNNIYPPTKTHA